MEDSRLAGPKSKPFSAFSFLAEDFKEEDEVCFKSRLEGLKTGIFFLSCDVHAKVAKEDPRGGLPREDFRFFLVLDGERLWAEGLPKVDARFFKEEDRRCALFSSLADSESNLLEALSRSCSCCDCCVTLVLTVELKFLFSSVELKFSSL